MDSAGWLSQIRTARVLLAKVSIAARSCPGEASVVHLKRRIPRLLSAHSHLSSSLRLQCPERLHTQASLCPPPALVFSVSRLWLVVFVAHRPEGVTLTHLSDSHRTRPQSRRRLAEPARHQGEL